MKSNRLRNTLGGAIAAVVMATTAGNAHAVLSSGLVEYWEMNGDYSAQVNPVHAGTQVTTGTGSGTFAPGKFGQAIDLESSTSNQAYITVGGPESDFDFAGGSMSVSLWYNVESLYTSWQALIAKGEGGAWRLARNSGSGNLIKFDVVGPTVDGKLNVAGWHHVVATVDAGGAISIHVDGGLAGVFAGPSNLSNVPTALQIGGNPQAAGRAWDGMLDDIGVWDRVLTANEIAALWNNGDGASIRSLVAPPTVPEPATAALALLGLGGLAARRRRLNS